tara:strand:+ start:572 stop:793 length:222 start_codon:yes stop_codon:yes gene_type:complete
MNDFSVFVYFIMFAATAGATFAFMWKMTSSTLEDFNKPRKKIYKVPASHPEMEGIKYGEELLVFNPEEHSTDK